MRPNNRMADQLREIKITRQYIKYAEASVLIEFGNTKIICNASLEANIPFFLKGHSQGWITAEYSMLPRATKYRNIRESINGKQNNRSIEIQRFIARSLRAAVDLQQLGEYTIILDCDVIQADGSTRAIAITGSCIVLVDLFKNMLKNGILKSNPLKSIFAGISVGIVSGNYLCDLEYIEDSKAEVDMNIVMMENGEIIEIHTSAEKKTFTYNQLISLISLGQKALKNIFLAQKNILKQII